MGISPCKCTNCCARSLGPPSRRFSPIGRSAPPGGAANPAPRPRRPPLRWRQTYGAGDVAEEFLRNYGYTEVLGPQAPWPAERISCGFLLLGPSTRYPPHRHLAEEIYLPLSGTAHWQQGARGWEAQPPGTVIHHESGVPHAMQTGSQPLLALYVWRGGHLDQKARMEREHVR